MTVQADLRRLNRKIMRDREHVGRYAHISGAFVRRAPDDAGAQWFLNAASGAIRMASRLNAGVYRDDVILSARVKILEARRLRLLG